MSSVSFGERGISIPSSTILAEELERERGFGTLLSPQLPIFPFSGPRPPREEEIYPGQKIWEKMGCKSSSLRLLLR